MAFLFGKSMNDKSVKDAIFTAFDGKLDTTNIFHLRAALEKMVGDKKVRDHITGLFGNYYKSMGANPPRVIYDSALILVLAQIMCREEQDYDNQNLSDLELSRAVKSYCTAREGESFAPEAYYRVGNAPRGQPKANAAGTGYSVYAPKTGMQKVAPSQNALRESLAVRPGVLTTAQRAASAAGEAAGTAAEGATGFFGTLKGYLGFGGAKRKTRKQKKSRKVRRVRKGRKHTRKH